MSMDINANIAKNIKKYREKLGMTQKDLADKLHFSNPSTVQKWEVGRNRVYPEYLYELSQIFGIGVEDMMKINNDIKNSILDSIIINPNVVERVREIYPAPVEYHGREDVIKAKIEFEIENINICNEILKKYEEKVDNWTTICSDEIEEWEDTNRFVILYNRKEDEIIGIRDYGDKLLYATDYLKAGYIPVALSSCASLEKEETKAKEQLFKMHCNDIDCAIDLINSIYPLEIERYKKAAASTEKKCLLIIERIGNGAYMGIDLDTNAEYEITKFDTDPQNFYVTDIGMEPDKDWPLTAIGNDDFELFFADTELLWRMGIFEIPKTYEMMEQRISYKYELIKKYNIPNPEADELYESVIKLLNTYPYGGRIDLVYKNLKKTFEDITEMLEKGKEPDEKIVKRMEKRYYELKEAYYDYI